MRVEITYKFVAGFIIVVGSVVFLNLLVPSLGIPEEMQQLVAVACAFLVGLVLGWFFSRAFTANIRHLREVAERLSHGDLSEPVRLPRSSFPDETADLATSLNRVVESLRELVDHQASAVKPRSPLTDSAAEDDGFLQGWPTHRQSVARRNPGGDGAKSSG
jgi:methyl-accepting chemotaxis protein